MGYQINSTWTKFRRKDIEKLNEIIDDEYLYLGQRLKNEFLYP